MAVATSGSRRLEIRLLGEPAFYSGGALQKVKLPAKSLALLCMLAFSADQPLDRSKLAFMLWPDESEEEAKANVRRHLYRLSRMLERVGDESQLAATSSTIAWMTDGPHTIDVVEFTRLSSSPESVDRAAAMYTGDLLSTLYDDCLVAPRERLKERQLQNLLALSSRYQQPDAKRALDYAEAALRIDPWREDALRCVMLALTNLGDRAAALREYDEFARRLHDEFDIEPGEETKRARQSVIATETIRTNLPRQLTSFVGRDAVVLEIEALLRAHRLVTVVGTGGAGKTRCAIEVGAKVCGTYDDGVWFVDLAPVGDPSHIAGTIARALGVHQSHDRPALDTLLAYLKRKHLLLVLDNCEHVIEEARRLVAALLQGCPEVRILATSREGLNIAGDQIYRMPSLAVPPAGTRVSARDTLAFGASRLFFDRASAIDNRFEINDDNAMIVAEICRRLDGIPLAIELAAARVKVLSPVQLAEKLDERFRVLTGGDRGALPRHRTMRALIDWSYDLLASDERALFRRISVFAGGFTLERALSICDDSTMDEIAMLDALSSLVDKSLLQVEPAGDRTRYRLLESVRQYARERLIDAGEDRSVADAHAAAFLAFAEDLQKNFEAIPDRMWAAQIEPEMENWRAALVWTLNGCGDRDVGHRLAGALRWMWFFFAPTEGRNWVRSALIATDTSSPEVTAKLDLAEAQLNISFSQYRASRIAADKALLQFEQLGDERGIAEAQWVAGRASLFISRVSEGESLLRIAYATARRLNLPKLTCWTLAALAHARAICGDFVQTRKYYDEALNLARAIRFQRMVAVLAGMLAEHEFRAGDASTALQLAVEAIDVARMLHDTRSVVTDVCNMAAYLTALERYDEARWRGREALALCCDAQFEVLFAFAMQHVAAAIALQPDDHETHRRECRTCAARLLGYVEMRLKALDATREYTEEQEYDKLLASLRETFGASSVAILMEEGSEWSAERAFAEAMKWSESRTGDGTISDRVRAAST